MWLPIALVAVQMLQAPRPETGAGDVLALQVMLDRGGFPPGAIDGRKGANPEKALQAFSSERPATGTAGADALAHYRITADDAAGPFVDAIPQDLMQQST